MKTASKSMGAKRKVGKWRSVPKRKVAPTQSLVVRAPDRKPWLLAPEEVTLLKNSICKGATDEQLKFSLAVARRYELDPFQQQIWFTPRWDKEAEGSDGKKGATVYVPVVGINGMLHIAARDHKDFGTYSEPEYGPMMEVKWGNGGKFQAPEWCRIEAWKKGAEHPTVAKVWWSEIYPDVDRAPLVRRMPRLMLAKCAKAQATRTSYPKTGGLLIPEETHTREFTDVTPGGRIMHTIEQPQDSAGVAQTRISELQAKIDERKEDPNATTTPSLFYVWYDQSQTAEISGPQSLLKGHRDLFEKLWNGGQKAIIANPDQLEALKYELGKRNVAFSRLRQPGE